MAVLRCRAPGARRASRIAASLHLHVERRRRRGMALHHARLSLLFRCRWCRRSSASCAGRWCCDAAALESRRRRPSPAALQGAAICLIAGAGLTWYFGMPWLVLREAIAHNESTSIETGERDRVFYREWLGGAARRRHHRRATALPAGRRSGFRFRSAAATTWCCASTPSRRRLPNPSTSSSTAT